MASDLLRDRLLERFGAAVTVDDETVLPTADVETDIWIDALAYARDELGCTFFDWLSAVDEQDGDYSVVAHLWSPEARHHLLVRTRVSGEPPHLPSATGVFRGANWHERETAEMFGIVFAGHPGLSPLLLPDGFEGHPLRKSFVLASRVAKPWPGEKDPGESGDTARRKRRRMRPPGVPEPEEWGPRTPGTPTADGRQSPEERAPEERPPDDAEPEGRDDAD